MRVVVVDDEPDLAQLMVELLCLEGFWAEWTDGEGATQMIHGRRPDVVLLDLMMPGVDGEEIHRRMLADPATASVPVVVISAMRDARGHAERMGAAGFLAKPFDMEELLDVVKVATAGGANRGAA